MEYRRPVVANWTASGQPHDPPAATGSRGISGSRCVVLGAGGFIGTNLCRMLQQRGAEVRGFGRAPRFPEAFKDIEWVTGDLADMDTLAEALAGRDYVFVLTGNSTPATVSGDIRSEWLKPAAEFVTILETCVTGGVRRIVYASSGGTIYGRISSIPASETCMPKPSSTYALGKLTAEATLAVYESLHAIDGIVLRISNPYGPFQTAVRGQGVVAATFLRAMRGEPVPIWGDGGAIRDFVYIEDVCDAFIRAAMYNGSSRIFNVGSGIGRTINAVIDDIERVISPRKVHRDYRLSRSVDIPANVLDISLVRREFGWVPQVDWETGLCRMRNWIESAL